jgi:hypothetical protein
MSDHACDWPGCNGQCHTGSTCPCHPADLPDRAVQPEAPRIGQLGWIDRLLYAVKGTDPDRGVLVEHVASGHERWVPVDASPWIDDPARAASQERPQPKTWRQPMADEPGGRRNPSYEIECGECGTRLRITNNYSPQGDFLDQSSEPVGVAQERPQPHDGCGCESCMCPDPSAHAGAQERPSIDVLAAFFHEEYWSETGDTHLPREQAESTDCEICWHSAAKLHGLLSSPEPVEPGE